MLGSCAAASSLLDEGNAKSDAQKPFFIRQCCPSSTFSSTDSPAKSLRFWNVRPIPRRQIT